VPQRFLVAVLVALTPAFATASPLVVHEWGTFTSIAGADGRAVWWRPLASRNDLPGFVHTLARPAPGVRGMPLEKRDIRGTVRMETPVIYFYAEREIRASVRVDFPSGQITEWYPAARTFLSGIAWDSLCIVPGADAALARERAPSHYYPAREVDAGTVESAHERERFLFYRGVGSFQPPLRATLSRDGVKVDGAAEVGTIILFERRGDRSGYRVVRGVGTFARPDLSPDHGRPQLFGDLRDLLVERGLYQKEARAMIETWKDTWFEDGLRVLYVLPDAFVEAVLPLSIIPPPAERVRVLVGRMEIVAPERLEAIASDLRVSW